MDFVSSVSSFIALLLASVTFALAGKIFSLLLIFTMIFAFVRAHQNPTNVFNFNDLFVDPATNKIGGSRMRLNVAFIICSWILIYYSLQGSLSEWLFGAYIAAFVADHAWSRMTPTTANGQATPTEPSNPDQPTN